MKNLWLFDERRLDILKGLLSCDSARGCDISRRLRIKKALLSYHLGVLRDRKMIEETRHGREKHYRIKHSQRPLIKKIMKIVQ